MTVKSPSEVHCLYDLPGSYKPASIRLSRVEEVELRAAMELSTKRRVNEIQKNKEACSTAYNTAYNDAKNATVLAIISLVGALVTFGYFDASSDDGYQTLVLGGWLSVSTSCQASKAYQCCKDYFRISSEARKLDKSLRKWQTLNQAFSNLKLLPAFKNLDSIAFDIKSPRTREIIQSMDVDQTIISLWHKYPKWLPGNFSTDCVGSKEEKHE